MNFCSNGCHRAYCSEFAKVCFVTVVLATISLFYPRNVPFDHE